MVVTAAVTAVKRFVLFWYDFVVGDDWRIAAGVVAGIVMTALLVRHEMNAWWAMPLACVATLAVSLRAGSRKSR
jgi:hypothetical protein